MYIVIYFWLDLCDCIIDISQLWKCILNFIVGLIYSLQTLPDARNYNIYVFFQLFHCCSSSHHVFDNQSIYT